MSLAKIKKQSIALLLLAALLMFIWPSTITYGQTSLDRRSIKIANPEVSATPVKYTLEYQLAYAYSIGSIRLQFCDNSPLLALPCDPIPGFVANTATINNQTGITDFSIAPGATNTSLIFTRTADIQGPVFGTIELDNITNPSATGTYFVRVQTYSSEDATGPFVEGGGATFVINEQVDFAAYVPPFLSFCAATVINGLLCSGASGAFIDMGELSPNAPNVATSQFLGQTNADNGFNVTVSGTPPTSGNNVINPLTTLQTSNPGTNQFGINLRDNSNPNVGANPSGAGTGSNRPDYNVVNQFKYVNGDIIYSTSTTSIGNKNTVSYLVNVSPDQKPGVYNTTLIYTALASF